MCSIVVENEKGKKTEPELWLLSSGRFHACVILLYYPSYRVYYILCVPVHERQSVCASDAAVTVTNGSFDFIFFLSLLLLDTPLISATATIDLVRSYRSHGGWIQGDQSRELSTAVVVDPNPFVRFVKIFLIV